MHYQPHPIIGFQSGLKKNKKPLFLAEDAFQTLENAYVYRDSVKKREGIKLVGRLRRKFTAQAAGNVTIGAGTTVFNLFTQLGISLVTEPDASIERGSSAAPITLAFGAPFGQTFTDSTGTGVMTGFVAPITSVTINYSTGDVTVINGGAGFAASALTATVAYFPGLPVMGIDSRELGAINDEQSVFFDTRYVYIYDDNDFDSPSTTTWSGSDSDFFWMANYRGINPQDRLFYVTNFTSPAVSTDNRIRYTNNVATWTVLQAQVDSTNYIFQAKLIIPYYGRLLLLNTWEGATAAASVNIYNRCRFSQIGNPLESTVGAPIVDTAWRSDQFGRGGFIDAPTNEAIVSCRFYKNTLIVFFERSTWQLRYVGEYGLPFIWERISSDFGSESTFSTVLFDKGVLAVGDKAIIASSGNDVERIDLEIPDEVFNFQNVDNGKERVHGIRDFQKELVYWTFVTPDADGNEQIYPNNVLIYNYRNNTWAKHRDNVTCFGYLQNAAGDLWDLPISWDSATPWDTIYQSDFPLVISGNQQGWIHYYQYPVDMDTVQDNLIELIEHESLFVKSVTLSNTASVLIEVPSHNIDQEVIYLTGLIFIDNVSGSPVTSSLNDNFYLAVAFNSDVISLRVWNPMLNDYTATRGNLINFTPAVGSATYHGGGVIALLPKLNILTKDFNPYQAQGQRIKTGFIDFNTDASPLSEVTVNLYIDSAIGEAANLPVYNPNMVISNADLVGQVTGVTNAISAVVTSPNHSLQTGRRIEFTNIQGMTGINGFIAEVTVINLNTFSVDIDTMASGTYVSGGTWETIDQNQYYTKASKYAWHRFYSNVFGQYITAEITYNDSLMNTKVTHESDFQMNGMTLYATTAGRLVL